jgi:hypothetical protein
LHAADTGPPALASATRPFHCSVASNSDRPARAEPICRCANVRCAIGLFRTLVLAAAANALVGQVHSRFGAFEALHEGAAAEEQHTGDRGLGIQPSGFDEQAFELSSVIGWTAVLTWRTDRSSDMVCTSSTVNPKFRKSPDEFVL